MLFVQKRMVCFVVDCACLCSARISRVKCPKTCADTDVDNVHKCREMCRAVMAHADLLISLRWRNAESKLFPSWLLGDESEAEGQRVLSVPFSELLLSEKKKMCTSVRMGSGHSWFCINNMTGMLPPLGFKLLTTWIGKVCFHAPIACIDRVGTD